MLRERSVPQKGRPGTRIVAGRALPSSGRQLGGAGRCAEYQQMKLALRQRREVAPAAAEGQFAGWLVAQFLPGGTAGASFAVVEAASAKAASLFLGAAAGGAGVLDGIAPATPSEAAEAHTLARRTADSLRSALDDAGHSVAAWPWDHLATMVTWRRTRAGEASIGGLGEAIATAGAAYARLHPGQLGGALDLWALVAAGLAPGGPAPDLRQMGTAMWQAWRAQGQ